METDPDFLRYCWVGYPRLTGEVLISPCDVQTFHCLNEPYISPGCRPVWPRYRCFRM